MAVADLEPASRRETPPGPLVLVAFGSFPGCPENPTPRVAEGVAGRLASERPVEVVVLDVVWGAPARLASGLARRGDLAGVIGLGVAGERRRIEVERRGRNRATRVDARGRRPAAAELSPGGPEERASRLLRPPFDAVLGRLSAEGLPIAASDDAGTYLCNALLYRLLGALDPVLPPRAPIGFVHIPHLEGITAPVGSGLPEPVVVGTIERLVRGLLAAGAEGRPAGP